MSHDVRARSARHPSCAGFVLLLTPTGGLPSRRWRWWAWVAAAGAAVFVGASAVGPGTAVPGPPGAQEPLAVQALAEPPLDALIPLAGVVVLLALVVAAVTLAVAPAAAFRPARRRIQTWSTAAATPNYPHRVRTVTPRTPTIAAADGRRARVRAGGGA